MEFKSLSDTSFSLTDKTEDGSVTKVYALPEHFSMWQSMHVGQVLKRLFKETGNLGELIMSAVFSYMSSGQSKEDELTKLLNQMKDATGGNVSALVKGGIDGVGDILDFLSKDDVLARTSAVLFLNSDSGETSLKDAELNARAELFQALPVETLFKGLWGFFGKRLSSTNSSDSPLLTSETQTTLNPKPSALNLIPSNASSTRLRTGNRTAKAQS